MNRSKDRPQDLLTDEFVRLPGLYRRWEFDQILEAGVDYHLEEAGTASDGTQLFAIYRREVRKED